ncbi:flocculation protein FLO11-like [Daucus carota subsp. sativus]|uniref:flocculation protein FLO11-like n=1 Tax=Daucus carota subsp. sativus TaxID=79200 RepID=UPI003083280A
MATTAFIFAEPAQDANSEPTPTTASEPVQASPQKSARFKLRAQKPARAKVPVTDITDFTVEEEQTPSTQVAEQSQALMVLPIQAVPLTSPTASSTSSEVDEEIVCKEQATTEAGANMSDPHTPVSDHGPSTPIPTSPMKIPEEIMSTTAFEFDGAKFVTNNYSAILDNDEAPKEFHLIQDFLAHSELMYALTQPELISPSEVLTFWRTTNYDDGGENGSPSLTCDYEGQEYVVSPATVRKALHLPEEKKYDASDKLKVALPDKYEALFSDENIPQPPSPAHEPVAKSDPKPTSGSSQQGPVEKSSPKRILRSTKTPTKPSPPPRKRRFLQKISDSKSDEDIPPPPPAKKLRKKIKPTSITDLTVEPPQSEDPEQALIPFSDQSAEPLLIEPLSAMPLDIAAADKQMLESTSDHNDQTEGNKSVEERIAADTDISEKPSDAPSKSEDAQIEMVLQLIQDSLVQPEDIIAAPAQEIPMAENSEAATEALESHTLSVFLADIDDDEGTEVTSTPFQAPGLHSIISEPVRETTPERVDSPIKALSLVRESTPYIAPAVPGSPLPSSEPARRRICHLSYNHRMCRTTSPSVEDRLTSIEATQASMHYTLADLSASGAQLVQVLTSADVKKGEKTSKDKCKPDQQIKRKKPDDDEEEKGEMNKQQKLLQIKETKKNSSKEAASSERPPLRESQKQKSMKLTVITQAQSISKAVRDSDAISKEINLVNSEKIPKQKGIVISEVNYTDINRPRTRSQTLSESDSKDKGKKPVDVVPPVPTMPKKSIITLAPENPTKRMIKLSKNIHIIANVSDQAEGKEAGLVRRRKGEFKSIPEKTLTSDIAQVKVPVTQERIEDTKVSWLKLNSEKTQDDQKKKSLYGSLDRPRVIQLGEAMKRSKVNALRAAIYQTGDETEELRNVKAQMIQTLKLKEENLINQFVRESYGYRLI